MSFLRLSCAAGMMIWSDSALFVFGIGWLRKQMDRATLPVHAHLPCFAK